jgi:hypothetical protein
MDRLDVSVEKSLRTKRAKFEVSREQYDALREEVFSLGLGCGNYSRLSKLALAHGLSITQNRSRTLLKSILEGLSFDAWESGKSLPKPDKAQLSVEDWELVRALCKAQSVPGLFEAIVRASKSMKGAL